MTRPTPLVIVAIASMALLACSSSEPQNEEMEYNDEVAPASEETTYQLDAAESAVMWKGSMLGMYSHEGTLNIKEGFITTVDGKVTGGKVVVDMSSMSPTDANFDEEKTPDKLVGHLSSADFFDVANFPTASLNVTSVKESKGSGKLTVRGNTGTVEFVDVNSVVEDDRFKAKANMTFDRTAYDVSWSHPIKENVLSNDIEIQIELVGYNK